MNINIVLIQLYRNLESGIIPRLLLLYLHCLSASNMPRLSNMRPLSALGSLSPFSTSRPSAIAIFNPIYSSKQRKALKANPPIDRWSLLEYGRKKSRFNVDNQDYCPRCETMMVVKKYGFYKRMECPNCHYYLK